ncbi:MAG: crossover junction endodeoxyribonuclease RuvC [Mariprofundaceae bacterium]|nr:crossover junction endodeoxyribonuclease RuvC [Mariprofundaceae bacterium]
MIKAKIRLLGIDPGSRKTGVGIIDVQGNRVQHIHHEVIHCGSGEFNSRLGILFQSLSAIIHTFQPQLAAIEDVFVSKNVSSALKLGQARGALIAACCAAQLEVANYTPTQIKLATVGHGRADKLQIQHMIKVLLKPPLPLAEDAADALAVCICHAHHAPLQQRLKNKAKP